MTAIIGSSLDGPPGLAKEGPGTLVLTGDNPYAGGIFVNDGALIVHGTATSAATIEVRNGTLLGGSGSLAPVTVRSGAELSPGPQPNARLTTEGLILDAGSTLTMDLDVIGDRIVVNGDLTMSGRLNARASAPLTYGTHTLISYTGTRGGSGLTLGSVPSGYTVALDYGAPGQVRLLVASESDRFVPVSLIVTGAMWKYFAQPSDPGAAWRSNSFDDTTWSSGPSMLGFGDANGLLPSTLIASNGQWTTYFRRAIYVPNPSQAAILSARILRDDAAVVYLNGAEIWRDENLPNTGAINYDTPAQAVVAGADESAWIHFAMNPAALVAGTNVIAIEVHQNALNSSDLAMNFELAATVRLPVDVHLTIVGDTLSWPSDAGWFSIYSTTDLTPPVVWTPLTDTPVLVGEHWTLSLPLSTNNQRFFRLHSP